MMFIPDTASPTVDERGFGQGIRTVTDAIVPACT